MLTLTENASTIVNDLTGTEEVAALRITSEAAPEPTFAISAATQPEPGDQVVEQNGAVVYLDTQAAEVLDDKVLDATLDESGNVQFALGIQES